MDNATLATLINELKALKIQESKLKTRESQIILQIEAINSTGNTTTTEDHTVASTRQQETTRTTPLIVNGIRRGDRVTIKNKIRRPATCSDESKWTKEKERVATVTRVTNDQIHFVTDNGTKTWRAPNNLSKLNNETANDERHR
jgi:hypothetical protein